MRGNSQKIQHRRGTADQWAVANPVLAAGELGYETDTRRIKFGDGVTQWSALAYAGTSGPQDLDGLDDVSITSPATGAVLRWDGSAWTDYSLTKSDLQLGNVDNTADSAKPVSVAQAAADAAVAAAATSDATSKSEAAKAHAVQRSNHTGTQPSSTISDFAATASAAAPVQSVAGRIGAIVLQVGDVSGAVSTSDSRLSDARSPLSHSHGNITSQGAIGSASGQLVVTTAGGVLTTSATISSTSVAGLAAVATAGTFSSLTGRPTTLSGYGITDAIGSGDARLTDARVPLDASVTTAKLADGAVTTAKIASGAVDTVDIATSAVTYPKIQNVTATDRVLGRSTAGAGVIEEITCTAFARSLIDDADSATARATLGLGTMATQAASDYLARAGGALTGAVQVAAGTAPAPGVAFVNDSDTGITQTASGGANSLSLATGGVERWRVSGDGSAQSVIPGGSLLYPQFACRAWVQFSGQRDTTGTVSTANTARLIRGSGNVASVTRTALGVYTITFATAMPDALYAIVGVNGNSDVSNTPTSTRIGTATAATAQIITCANNASGGVGGFFYYDADAISIAVFR